MKRRESDSFLMLFLKLRGGINVWGIKRSDLFIAHANDIKCFVIQ